VEASAVILDVQRVGPSTGLPTRTAQGDILSTAFLSHGDTKHPLLFPSSPEECFTMAVTAFDLAEEFQTPVFVMTDLDLGMNHWMSDAFEYPAAPMRRGKVLNAADLDRLGGFARYKDVDGDGVGYRTLPAPIIRRRLPRVAAAQPRLSIASAPRTTSQRGPEDGSSRHPRHARLMSFNERASIGIVCAPRATLSKELKSCARTRPRDHTANLPFTEPCTSWHARVYVVGKSGRADAGADADGDGPGRHRQAQKRALLRRAAD
jgi:hypothetical protein